MSGTEEVLPARAANWIAGASRASALSVGRRDHRSSRFPFDQTGSVLLAWALLLLAITVGLALALC